ncbi:LOW QUALITY PROTEIN: hypothetical protein Cgig2_010495 [Carnegiea gigantea]|uniref:Aminotransferase-like plant mobile domain-containing protein n=1 Tax=Carnegiea gigantea TaxID=171969 RepID=A0A9Q1KTH8_9CARY|nr:LOW QUALITY PROTEIN: hypothetical protein Cgig2_010495 [Carnegiea gigantea]
MDGSCGSQRAPLENGDESTYDPIYRRSRSLKTTAVSPPSDSRVIWVRKEKVRKGTPSYSYNDEKSCINVCRDHVNFFDAMILEKVNTQSNGDEKFLVIPSFYPALHRLLTLRRNWGVDFKFQGLSNFMVGAIEWTEYILKHFEHTLRSANIYGAVGVSCYPYHFDRDVWRAFCELWGPLINTLHHGAGEVDISLYDLEMIGGLPILGDVYEEFLPPNEDLMDAKRFSPTVLELLRIHAELCRFHKSNHIHWNWWLDHFYRRELTGVLLAEKRRTSSNPPRISQRERLSTLNVTNIVKLAAFLAFWLSRFILPYRSEVIRLETFVMASLMAKGQRISLAPTVLRYIYHGLGQVASHPDHPGRTNPYFSVHFVVGWSAEMFPALYSQRPDFECPADYPVLMRYAGMSAKRYTLAQARSIFRNGQSISFRASAFCEQSPKGRDLVDMKLSDKDLKFLLSIRSSVLSIRVGSELLMKPYYPNRFPRQFGFDQGVPANNLSFAISLRQKRNMMDLAQAVVTFYRRDTGAKFYIPNVYFEGLCTWIGHSDAVETAIVPMLDILDDLVEAMPIQSIPTSLASLFYNLEEDWVRESILKGVGAIIDIISNHSSARDLLASRARIFQSLSALRSMIDIYKLSTIEICWLSSKVEEIFGVVEAAAKIEELVDVDRVKALSDQDLTCSSEIVRIESELNSLSNEVAKLKVKEQEILRRKSGSAKCEKI